MLENKIQSTPVLIEDLGMVFATKTSKRKARYGIYQCECGNKFKANSVSVKSGNTKSCGCYARKRSIIVNTTHGLSKHRLFPTWANMIKRCYDINSTYFKYYGEREISVCERWMEAKNFIEDMYPTYKEGLSIDRIDVNGNYEPSNCRWATKEVQARNTRILRDDNTSGYRGVCFVKAKNRWSSRILVSYNMIYLGSYKTPIEAAIAYDTFVIENDLEHAINGVCNPSAFRDVAKHTPLPKMKRV